MRRHPDNASSGSGAFAVLKDLTAGVKSDPRSTFDRLAELLAPSKLRGTLQIWLVSDEPSQAESCFRLTSAAKKWSVSTAAAKKVNVELAMKPEVWSQIASGRLAPHDAFLSGRMRVRGNTALAQEMLKHLAGSSGRTHLCLGGE